SVAATRPYGISNGGVPLAYPVNISLQVVGSFQARDAETYWHVNDFELSVIKDRRVNVPPVLQGLVSSRTLLSYFDAVAHNELLTMQQQNSPLIGEPDQSDQVYFPELPTLYYYAALNPAKINLTALDNLTNRLAGVQTSYSALMASANPTFPYIEQITPSGDMFSFASHPSILEKFRDQLAIVQVPTAILGLQITALVLFFVSVMAGLLVDRQAEAIAVLRSRGASGRQVLGSLVTQGLGAGLFALLIGPPLALVFVYAVAARLLPSASQNALDVITNSPMQALKNVAWYALAAVGVTLLTMLFSLYRAARLDIVSVRREITRSTRRPLWQRLRLDIWGLVVALTGYALSLYLMNTTQFLDAQARVLVTSPLTMIAPIFLILAGVLAFLRFFPMLLRLISTIALRGRSASS
ncbi:MAG: FtsX-like permease family protein, partial [Ktedonobacteraceae bacterium]